MSRSAAMAGRRPSSKMKTIRFIAIRSACIVRQRVRRSGPVGT